MTHEQLEQQSKEAVIAYLQDSDVRLEFKFKNNEKWEINEDNFFNLDCCHFRIAQPKPWYRVALMTFGTKTVDDENIESYLETNDCFIKWLTERIEY